MFPFLFSILLNDLKDYFCQLGEIPLEKIRDKLESELHVYYKLFAIIYADDTVILSQSKDGLQKALDIFESYCEPTTQHKGDIKLQRHTTKVN